MYIYRNILYMPPPAGQREIQLLRLRCPDCPIMTVKKILG